MYQVWGWWAMLSCVQIFNLKYAVREYMKAQKFNHLTSARYALLYTSVCAFRTFLPRQDVSKICVFNTPLSSVFIGRSLATWAEIAFIKQLYLFNNSVLKTRLSYNIVYAIYIAEVFSWLGTLTENQIFNTSEEITWTATIFYILYKNVVTAIFSKKYMPQKVRKFLYLSILFKFLYIVAMVKIDIPNYLNNWQTKTTTFSLQDGFYRSISYRTVSTNYEDWKIHIGWMTPYFTVAVWYSILMARYQSYSVL